MKIGILADTHLTKISDNFKNLVENYFQDVDLIIHTGDFISFEIYELLKSCKSFCGVWGNVDDSKVQSVLKEKEVITVAGYKIGIFHGHGSKGTTIDRVYNKFADDMVDIIIFGHSHQPLVKTQNGILMINPGSMVSKRRERWFSFAILELLNDAIDLTFKLF